MLSFTVANARRVAFQIATGLSFKPLEVFEEGAFKEVEALNSALLNLEFPITESKRKQ